MKDSHELVILAGGKGTRLLPHTKEVPKPLLKIGNVAIIEHIIRNYVLDGFSSVKILLGKNGDKFKQYFKEHEIKNVTIEFYNTGINTNTSERIWQIRNKVSECFALSYGDILSDVNFAKQYDFHKKKKKIMNIVIVPLRTNYGVIHFNKNCIAVDFNEKPIIKNYWINGGSFIIESKIFEHWNNDDGDFSKSVIPFLCQNNKVSCFKHEGFWQGVDFQKDYENLIRLWNNKEGLWVRRKNNFK